jgi:hypothetical protein
LEPFALCALARPLYRPDFVAVHIFCILWPFITVSWSCLPYQAVHSLYVLPRSVTFLVTYTNPQIRNRSEYDPLQFVYDRSLMRMVGFSGTIGFVM